jgi:outer membrane receptor protein involved in Fe transport
LGHSAQLNLQVAGNGAKRYRIGGRLATLQYGGKFRNAHKFSNTYVLTLTPNGTVPLSMFQNRLTNSNYYNGGDYKLGYNASEEDVIAFANANPSAFTSSSTFGQDPSQFDLVEKVGAGYLMNTIDLSSRLRFIAGLRVEGTTDSVINFSLGNFPCPPPESGTCSSINPNHFSGSYYTLLPSASLRYSIGPNSYFRFVYARGLARPDPQDIAQALSWTDTGNGANRYSASFGNANLKAETADDLDVLFDHYLNSFGMISVGYFYKFLRDPIVSNKHFTFLPGMWGGFGLSANYGYTVSSTSGIPGRSDHPRLLRMSPNAFNISPTYDHGRISIRVGLSYNQASIYSYQYTDGLPGGVNGPLSDIYFYSHFQVDAQGSVRLTHGLSFLAYVLNLNNEVFGFYQGSPQYMIQREYYQPTVAAGFRWVSGREK